MKYSFTKCNDEGELFKVDGCDSWDEAIRQVEKGINGRDAVLADRADKEKSAPATAQLAKPASAPPAPAKPDMVEKYDEDGKVIK